MNNFVSFLQIYICVSGLDCDTHNTCAFHDLLSVPNFLPTTLVGEWQMVAHATPEGVNVFSQFTTKFLYVHDNKMEFAFTGKRK